MPRRRLTGAAGVIFHVINRGAKRDRLFDGPADYDAFENLLLAAQNRVQIPIYAYCLMPNHWHLVVQPRRDGDLSTYLHDLTGTHALQWNVDRNAVGQGAVYQGRFRAIPVQNDQSFLRVCRYVERNPLRAGLVTRAADWKWCSLWRRVRHLDRNMLDEWPVRRPEPWAAFVGDDAVSDADLEGIRSAVRGSVPYGSDEWRAQTAARLGLPTLERGRGRPKKPKNLPTLF
jgi:putative transposase